MDDQDYDEDEGQEFIMYFHYCYGTGFCAKSIKERQSRLFRGYPDIPFDSSEGM